MKKIILSFLLIFNLSLFGQSLIPTKFGLKIGANLDNLQIMANDGIKPSNNSSMSGITGGICVYIPLTDKWYLNPELLFAQKGSPFSYDFTHDYNVNQRADYNIENTLLLSYLQVNPIMSYKTSDYISLNFGPSVSFLLSEEFTSEKELLSGNNGINENSLLDGVYSSESLDIGLNFGLSYFIKENLLLEANVYTGLIDVGEIDRPYQQNQGTGDSEYTVKNQGVTFIFSYIF